MASTRLHPRADFFISLLTLMLLSASQGVKAYGMGEWHYFGRNASCDSPLERSSFDLRFTEGEYAKVKTTTFHFNTSDQTGVSAELLQRWKELYNKIREEEKLVQNLFRDATNAQFKAGTQLRSAELKKDMIDPVLLNTLQTAYDKSVADLKKANLQQKEIKKLVEKSRKINSKPGGLTEKKVDGIRSVYNEYLSRYNPDQPPIANPVETTPAPAPPPVPPVSQPDPEKQAAPTETQPTTQGKPTAQPKPAVQENKPSPAISDVNDPTSYDPDMINRRPGQSKSYKYISQPFRCNFEIDTMDQASGMVIKALKPGVLFTHTDPDLKPYFKGKDLITCLGRIAKTGSYVQLTIEFQIASSHSQSNFGSLEEGSLLRFKLMNDEYISLFNLKTNAGHIDPYTGYTIFSGQYALGKQEINKLSTLEIDKMRVLWSTGFEDYDVYHIDFLINQLNCVLSK